MESTSLADHLALLNATLNGASFVCLFAGWHFIRRKRTDAHRKAMLTAFGLSCLFLVSYLVRLALSGTHHYPAGAPLRAFYLAMLASHVVLAAAVPFLAVSAIWLGLTERLPAHRKVVKWALPIWMYVSLSGVGVYLLLYKVAGV